MSYPRIRKGEFQATASWRRGGRGGLVVGDVGGGLGDVGLLAADDEVRDLHGTVTVRRAAVAQRAEPLYPMAQSEPSDFRKRLWDLPPANAVKFAETT